MSTDLLLIFFPLLKRNSLSCKDWRIFEMFIFFILHEQLCVFYQEPKLNEMEDVMVSAALIKGLLTDLLLNQDYSVEGLAKYTGYPEEVIYDLASGLNSNSTLSLSAKIFELHAIARREFYQDLINRFLTGQKGVG